jgi:hypothetical protein
LRRRLRVFWFGIQDGWVVVGDFHFFLK